MNDERDRDRLVKILRMFSSNHDGEVAAAARRAHELLKDRALDWDDLIIKGAAQPQHQEYQRPERQPESAIELIRGCADCEAYLNGYEQHFIESIRGSLIEWGRLTPKQRTVLDRIVNKLKMMGVWQL
jgi:hypothetical protein